MNRRDFIVSALGAAAMVALPLEVRFQPEGGAKYVHKTVRLAYTITQESIDQGLYGDMGQRMARALAKSMSQTYRAAAARVMEREFDE